MSSSSEKPRRSFSGRRLVAATVASLALHSLLFHGLTRLHLGDITPNPLGEKPTSPRPEKPRRPVDFSLRVPKAAASRQPAYEKPLSLPQSRPQPTRQPTPLQQALPRPKPRRAPDQPRRLATTPTRADGRSQALPKSNPLDRREAEAPAASPVASAPVAPLPAAALASPPTVRQPVPAAMPARETEAAAASVGRWRPREAVLLAQLAAGSSPQSDRGEPTPRRPVVARVPRAGGPTVVTAETSLDASAAPLPDQPPAEPPQPQSLPRPQLTRSRLAAVAAVPGGGLTSPAGRTAGPTARDGVANASLAGGRPLPPPRSAGQLGETSGMANNSGTASPAGLTRRADLLGTAAEASGTAAPVAKLAMDGDGSATAQPGGKPDLGRPGPAPAAMSRLATLAGRGSSTAATIRSLPAGDTADASDPEEGLSVSGEELRRHRAADDMADGSQRPAGPSLARIAAAALPADGRVRDVAEAFAGRLADQRMAAATAKVADREALAQADALIERGLEFLARSQQADGRWSLASYAGSTPADAPRLTCDTAATGLALLSFLGAGHDHFAGPYRDVVRRGLEWLLAVQQPNGDLYLQADPLSNSCGWMYSHAIATMALCEAVGMTGDPLLQPAAEKACQFISASQHASGGWRYVPGTDSDLSVSGWMLVALRAGALAGVPVAPETFSGVRALVERSASPVDPTRYTYNPRDSQQRRSPLSVSCMTAVGALMRLHTGVRAGDRLVARPAELLVADPPSYGSAESRRRDAYLWYYASQVLVHTGGKRWDRWYRDLVELLSEHQQRTGPAAGSWDPLGSQPDRWGHYGGRIYVTALHLLALEVPARHLPTYSVAAQKP